MKINFTCPSCGSTLGIEQVVTGQVVISKVYEIEPDGSVQTDMQKVAQRGSTLYECRDCGWTIHNDYGPAGPFCPTCPTELFAWLKERKMLGD